MCKAYDKIVAYIRFMIRTLSSLEDLHAVETDDSIYIYICEVVK